MPTKHARACINIELPEICGCGSETLKIWGTRIEGRARVDIKCMRCGKILWDMDEEDED